MVLPPSPIPASFSRPSAFSLLLPVDEAEQPEDGEIGNLQVVHKG